MASRASKSPNAFRTISEVADSMGIPQHVLRFWESKFSQITPMKRGGGRRYYRPEDVEVIEAIRKLLHEDGYTIKGAQKYLKENGVASIIQNTQESVTQKDNMESGPVNEYEAQILTITKKDAQLIQDDADTVMSLKEIRGRLEKIRQQLSIQ